MAKFRFQSSAPGFIHLPRTKTVPKSTIKGKQKRKDSSVSTVTRLRNGPPSNCGSIHGRENRFFLPQTFGPALETTQPAIQRVLWALSPGIKRTEREADYSPPSSSHTSSWRPHRQRALLRLIAPNWPYVLTSRTEGCIDMGWRLTWNRNKAKSHSGMPEIRTGLVVRDENCP
jgi:hypothetical protein